MQTFQPKQLAKLFTRVANVMLMYKRYPTKRDYEQVARQTVEKYPFLASIMMFTRRGGISYFLNTCHRDSLDMESCIVRLVEVNKLEIELSVVLPGLLHELAGTEYHINALPRPHCESGSISPQQQSADSSL